MRKVFVAGGAHTTFIGKLHPDFIWKGHKDFGKRENPHLDRYIHQAALAALKHAGAEPAQVDRGFVGNFVGDLFDNQGHLGAVLAAAHKDLAGKPITRVEGACASGGLAFAGAIDAVRAGADVVLVVGAEVQTTVNAKIGADYLARAADYRRQRGIDEFTFPCLFARRARAIVEKTETTLEDCARVAVKAYANANRNPYAHMHGAKMTLEQANTITDKNPAFLGNAEYKEYLRVSDCSQVSDGGSAIVVCSEEGLKKLGRRPAQAIELLANAVVTASIAEDPEPTALRTTEVAGRRAYQAAGLKAADINVAEVHDCFTITEILMLEALGFAEAGKGARLVREGATELGGRLPVNTGGGLVAFGHPVGATGVKQVLEVYRQMKGQCGDYQLGKPPRHGLTANMGGDDRTAVVSIFRNLE
jgi:acetyl-CoA acetyltransferase